MESSRRVLRSSSRKSEGQLSINECHGILPQTRNSRSRSYPSQSHTPESLPGYVMAQSYGHSSGLVQPRESDSSYGQVERANISQNGPCQFSVNDCSSETDFLDQDMTSAVNCGTSPPEVDLYGCANNISAENQQTPFQHQTSANFQYSTMSTGINTAADPVLTKRMSHMELGHDETCVTGAGQVRPGPSSCKYLKVDTSCTRNESLSLFESKQGGDGVLSIHSLPNQNTGHAQIVQHSSCSSNMSLWAKTQQLPEEALRQIQTVYGVHFPIEVRHYFAEWIEDQPWNEIEEDNPQHEGYAKQLLDNLLSLLDSKAAEMSSPELFLPRLKLQETSVQFKELYTKNPYRLVDVVKTCLASEKQLIDLIENPVQGTDESTLTAINHQISKETEVVRQYTSVTENDLKVMQHKQESFVIKYQEQAKINGHLQQVLTNPNTQNKKEEIEKLQKRKEEMEHTLLTHAQELLTLRISLSQKHNETFQLLDELQKKVVDGELIKWKRRQQLAGNGGPPETQFLESLQHWCESLAELLWKSRQQIVAVERLRAQLPIDMENDILPTLNNTITGLLSSLVTSTFVVETQPPQVLKKDSRFTATVRLLVGGKLNLQMNPPAVKASIISENQAKGLLKSDTKSKTETSGEILNNNGTMDYHQATGQLSITFRNMQLKRIKRAERKGSEAVTEEKFCILFQSDFAIGSGEGQLMFQVWTLSLPVVVTVHGNQEPNAMATVLWDNQFAEPCRSPFVVPDTVPWPEVCELLGMKFKSMTGRGLTQSDLNYLATKIFNCTTKDDYSQHMITWANFNKDTLPGRNFTFWEWFYAVMKLTRESLRGPWNDESIIGFIGKLQAQDCLLSRPVGTFLLRFSDSETGGITIAWVAEDPSKPGTGEKQVWNLAPFTTRDFSIRGLADRVKDLNTLIWLYPDKPKESAFEKYCSSVPEMPSTNREGYIPAQLINTIPGYPCASPMGFDNPQTPQYMGPESPPPASVSSYSSNPVTPLQLEEAMDDTDQLQSFFTDYNPDDISNIINVNELLNSTST